MRYGIFSDVHSNLEALDSVIEAYREEDIDVCLCVGDIVGYAANPKECVRKIDALAEVTVAGNHDWASVNLFSWDYFNPFAKEAVAWTSRILQEGCRRYLETRKPVYQNADLTLVHGTLDYPGDFQYMTDAYLAAKTFMLLRTDICFVGHTHVAGVFIQDSSGRIYYRKESHIPLEPGNRYIVNAGSVGQPRDGNPKAAYCIYDTLRRIVQIKRTSYDILATQKKIIAQGLPAFLAERLSMGR